MAHCLDLGQFWDIWPWLLTLTFGKGHRHLNHWMRFIELYLGTKKGQVGYEIWTQVHQISTLNAIHDSFGPCAHTHFKFIIKSRNNKPGVKTHKNKLKNSLLLDFGFNFTSRDTTMMPSNKNITVSCIRLRLSIHLTKM